MSFLVEYGLVIFFMFQAHDAFTILLDTNVTRFTEEFSLQVGDLSVQRYTLYDVDCL